MSDSEPEQIRITFPDGSMTKFEGVVSQYTGRCVVSVIPGTNAYTPGPWYRRLAYWLRSRLGLWRSA